MNVSFSWIRGRSAWLTDLSFHRSSEPFADLANSRIHDLSWGLFPYYYYFLANSFFPPLLSKLMHALNKFIDKLANLDLSLAWHVVVNLFVPRFMNFSSYFVTCSKTWCMGEVVFVATILLKSWHYFFSFLLFFSTFLLVFWSCLFKEPIESPGIISFLFFLDSCSLIEFQSWIHEDDMAGSLG